MTTASLSPSVRHLPDQAEELEASSILSAAAFRDVLSTFLATRIVLLLIGYLATRYLVPWGQSPPSWRDCFSHFDGLWYIKIAREGYFFDPLKQSSIAFAPLLPIFIRIFAPLIGATNTAYVIAGVAVSNLSLLVALLFVRATTREFFGEAAAKRSVWYVLISPGTLYLSTIYPMSLMIAIGSAALWFARRERWGLAATIGMLAPLARPDGVLVLLPLLVEAARSPRSQPHNRRFLWLLLVPLMCEIWLSAQWLAFGTPLAFFRAQEMWDPSPYVTVVHSSRAMLIMGTAAFFVLLTVWGWFRLPAAWSLYASLFLVVMLSASRLWSLPRYDVMLFPCFITLAWAGTRWRWLHLTYVFAAMMIATLFTARFTLGLWVA